MANDSNQGRDDNPWMNVLIEEPTVKKKEKKNPYVKPKFTRYFDETSNAKNKQTSVTGYSENYSNTQRNDTSKSFNERQKKRKHPELVSTDIKAHSDEMESKEWHNDDLHFREKKIAPNSDQKKQIQRVKREFKDDVYYPYLKKSNAWKGRLAKLGVKSERYEKFSGRVPVAPEKLQRYSRGEGMDLKGVNTRFHAKKLQKREVAIEKSVEQAARTELLLPEDGGYLVADTGEITLQYSQKKIAANVDITSATKHFELQLNQFGPYRMDYNRSGRYLLLGGKKGHIAAIDWVTKRLYCEMNVMEEIYDVKWLHVETMFAVAQKNWVYVYDNQGIELHCLKQMNKVLRMEFLPYHFLLATANEEGYLSWLDISIGKFITTFNTRLGRLNIMAQNPANAVLCLGHAKGIVTMWSPNVRDPLAKMLCHRQPVTAVAVDHRGLYMATASVDRSVKIWDVRMLEGPLQEYRLRAAATNLALSQRGLLSIGMGNVVEVYKDSCTKTAEKAYLRHKLTKSIGNLQFCPYEDVLGVASAGGFTSIIIPGAGEPNFDALESNPYQTKSQRKESEVKALLEKIQPEFITLDPSIIAEVDLPSVKEKMELQLKQLHFKPPKVDLEHRKKSKGKKGSAKIALTKKILNEEQRKELIKTKKQIAKELQSSTQQDPADVPTNVLDRFKPKKMLKR